MATVFNIQRCSLHDGPGVRTTVFLKGCPLRCLWCHNPESIDPLPQLAFANSRCVGCGECQQACPIGAQSILGSERIVRWSQCRRCGRCVEVCYAEALEIVGREMGVEEALAIVERDRDFYASSGGGATLSGGEPLFQPDFSASFLRGCRQRGVHAALDTSGYSSWDSLLRVAVEADLVLYDLKHTDSARHRELTGVPNEPIIRNLVRLLSEDLVEVWVRVPVVPGYNDEPENYLAMADLLGSFGDRAPRIDLLPYHQLGASKHSRLGTRYRLSDLTPPSPEVLERAADLLRAAGLRVQVGG